MYLLYLDDSGSIGNKDEDYFVLGGVCVPENSVRWLSYRLEEIAIKFDPDSPENVEFHAAAIFSGRQFPWKSILEKDKRKEIICQVLNILQPAYADTVIFACAIHKASYPDTDLVQLAFEQLSSRFDMYLQRHSNDQNRQRGIIIIDKTTSEEGLQNLTSDIRRSGNRWGNQLRNICEVPLFIDSRAARIVQLADHIAYAVFRRYNANDLTYFNCIENRFDQEDGRLHGLVHLQLYKRTCTCPACITRRERPSTLRDGVTD